MIYDISKEQIVIKRKVKNLMVVIFLSTSSKEGGIISPFLMTQNSTTIQ